VHPREFLITSPSEESQLLWVYIWTLTFGGRQSLPDEYRIQMTTVTSPLQLNAHGPTVLLGYEPTLKLFAGFDVGFHQRFTEGSPMVSVDIRAVKQAQQDGLSFHRKSNREMAIGIRPDQLVNYAHHAAQLHKLGKQSVTLHLLNKAVALEPISRREIASLPEQRKRIVQTVSRLSRDGNFKKQVLCAYDNRCAVTRTQLKLVDAAHILPVGAPGSVDDVCNGIALSPTYHRAYDNGLIYLDEGYTMQINPAKADELASLNLAGGIEQFRSHLGRILLPYDSRQRPDAQFIRKANQYRLAAS
jgi:putative restriction endonuclease